MSAGFRKITLAILLFAKGTLLCGQAPNIQWQKNIGGSLNDNAYSIQPTDDGGYIVAGSSSSNNGDISGNHGLNDFCIIKLSASGAIVWQKSYGGSGNDVARSIEQTTDGGYIVAGYTDSKDGDVTGYHVGMQQGGPTWDFWVIKISSTGALQWQKALGGTLMDMAYSVKQTNDGGYVVAGETDSKDGDVHGYHDSPLFYYTTDFWVVKLSSNGNIQWDKAYGGVLNETANSVQQTADGGFMVTGSTQSYDGFDVQGSHIHPGAGAYPDCWVIKLDSVGSLQWQKCLGGSGSDMGFSGLQTGDGGYIVASYTNSNDGDVSGSRVDLDYWVAKLDITGNIQWQKCYGGSGPEIPREIQQTAEGGYIITGETYSSNGDVSGLNGKNDFWLVKISDSGVLEWQKCLGGSLDEDSYSVKQTPDGGYIMAGITMSSDGDVTGNKGAGDFWIVKLGPPPCIPSVVISASDSSICPGAAVTFQSEIKNGGTNPSYQWLVNGLDQGSDSSFTIDSLHDGDSVVCRLTSSAACASDPVALSDTIIIRVMKVIKPSISIQASSSSICQGTAVVFTATAINAGTSPSFQWLKNGENVGKDSSTYLDSSLRNNDLISCIVTSGNICAIPQQAFSDTISMKVDSVVTPTIQINASANNICPGAYITFAADINNGGTSPVYQWEKDGTPVGSNSSVYIGNAFAEGDMILCNLISNEVCALPSHAVSNRIPVEIRQPVNVNLGNDTTICEGSSTLISPNFRFKSYLWQDGSTDSTYLAQQPGIYDVQVSDECNNKSSDTITIKIFNKVKNFLPKDTAVCSYGDIVLESAVSFKNYLWANRSVSSSIRIDSPGTYWLQGTDFNGCENYDTVVVSIKACQQGFYVPNAFTPNGDGINDRFKPLLFGAVDSYKFSIFNQWGQAVFESTDVSKGWDGNYKGQNQDSHVFVWICRYKFKGDIFRNEHGTVILIR